MKALTNKEKACENKEECAGCDYLWEGRRQYGRCTPNHYNNKVLHCSDISAGC